MIILAQDCIVFDEIDTSSFSVAGVAEFVAISCNGIIFICCYRHPLATDTTLLTNLDSLLNQNTSLSPIICGDFNVHESVWLQSFHTSSAGTATMDFCDSRGLHQLITFPTSQNAILDLVISEHTGATQVLPNFNTSDHVAILVSFDALTTNIVYLSAHRVFYWSRAPWNRLSHFFSSFNWDISGSVDDATTHVSSVIISAVEKFIPSCIPKLSCPTPWWNHHC